jgi:uncharacterized RDD family membrane protein YckC
VTFDDLPACPRCKESFALVRPLASTSFDGARHVLRDDPEQRLKLRDRLHRARLDRRKQNQNPLALGPDPDAPDWFEPGTGGGNGAAEAATSPAPGAAKRSKESTIVPIDDPTADDDVRAGTTTTDSGGDAAIIEASREPEDGDAPAYSGDIPGFSDWREELRERLKRIRARREQERRAEEDKAAAEAAEAEQLAAADETVQVDEDIEVEVDEHAEADIEEQAEAEIEADEEAGAEIAAAEEAGTEVDEQAGADGDAETKVSEKAELEKEEAARENDGLAAGEAEEAPARATAGDLIARIVDGSRKRKRRNGEAAAADKPSAIVLGEKDAEPAAPFDPELDASPEGDEDRKDEILLTAGAETDAEPEEAIDDTAELDLLPAASLDELLEYELDETEDTEASADADEAEATDEEAAPAAGPKSDTPEALGAGEPSADETAARADRRRKRGRAFDWGPFDETVEPALKQATDAEPALKQAADVEPALEEAGADEPASGQPAAAAIAAKATAAEGPPPAVGATDDAPELDFETLPRLPGRAPEIDLPEPDDDEEPHGLEWDSDSTPAPRPSSSVAPLAERAAAALCDALVLTAIAAALVATAASGAEVPYRRILVDAPIPLAMTWAIFAIGYSVFLVGACGQTIGRMVMRLRVVGEDQFSVGFKAAAVRLGAWVISALPAFAGMLPALRDPRRRALHDRLSRTRVVKA